MKQALLICAGHSTQLSSTFVYKTVDPVFLKGNTSLMLAGGEPPANGLPGGILSFPVINELKRQKEIRNKGGSYSHQTTTKCLFNRSQKIGNLVSVQMFFNNSGLKSVTSCYHFSALMDFPGVVTNYQLNPFTTLK